VRFLASDDARWITASTRPPTGGSSAPPPASARLSAERIVPGDVDVVLGRTRSRRGLPLIGCLHRGVLAAPLIVIDQSRGRLLGAALASREPRMCGRLNTLCSRLRMAADTGAYLTVARALPAASAAPRRRARLAAFRSRERRRHFGRGIRARRT
jgi:hypothetical protein